MPGKKPIDQTAFTIRQPRLKLWHMALIGTLMALAIIFTNYSSNDALKILVTIVITMSIVSLLYLIQNQGQDERTATEFQALAFSGAMRINSILTLILYRDGGIFYLDPRYTKNFTNGAPYHNLDQFLTTMGVENDNKAHIYDAIRGLNKSEFEYVYKEGRKSAPLRIGVYPLERPEGFVALTLTDK